MEFPRWWVLKSKKFDQKSTYSKEIIVHTLRYSSRVSNIESDNSQNIGLEDYNNISDGIFPYFTTPSIKITLG